MPKAKTTKAISKRILKLTKKGKVLRRKITTQHLVRKKSKRSKSASGKVEIFNASKKEVNRLVPYL